MSYRLEISAAVLLAAAIAVGLWAANRQPKAPDFDFRSSTYLTGPTGSKGLHEILVALGRPVERRRTSLKTLATGRAHQPAILVLLDPVIDLDGQELGQLVRYVRAGGAVLASGDGAGVTSCAGWRVTRGSLGADGRDSIGVRSREVDVRLPYTRLVLTRLAKTDSGGREPLSTLRKAAPDDEDGRPGACNTLVPFQTDTVVVALSNRPAILRLRYRGGGTIILAADPGWLTNRAWRDTNRPIALLPLLTPGAQQRKAGRVVWDEYHQGFGYGSSTSFSSIAWSWLISNPGGWALLQLVAVGVAWLAMTAVRFGPAQSVIDRRRRSPLEHLEALGAGLENATGGGVDTAVERLAQGLRRRLSRSGHVGNGNLVPWLQSLELAVRGTHGRAAVRRLQHLLTARDRDEQRVLAAAQAVEDVWEELGPRTTRNAS
jgi:hypothetical protein